MAFKEKFMKRAIEISLEKMRENIGGPFGCVIVKNDEIIAEGWNKVTSTNDPTAHGEVVAIREACKKLNSFQLTGCEVYTSSEPCPMCLAALYWARPQIVYFANSIDDAAKVGFDDKMIYEELILPTSERKLPMERIVHSEAYKAFEEWQIKGDKAAY